MTTVSLAVDQPRSVITAGELIENGFFRVKNEFKDPIKVIDILNYIEFLAMNNSCPGDKMEIQFTEEYGKKVISISKNEVNALFFAYAETRAKEQLENTTKPSIDSINAMKAAFEVRKLRSIQEIKSSVDSARRSAMSYYAQGEQSLQVARSNQLRIDTILGKDPIDFVAGMLQSIESTNFNFHRYVEDNNTIEFVNKVDVLLRHSVPHLGLDYSLNCGRFLLRIKLNDMIISVYKYENNVTSSTMHPHMLDGRAPCWGNGADAISNAIISGDVGTIVKVVDSILQTYNDGNPYVSINDYAKGIKDRDERKARDYGRSQGIKTEEETLEDEFVDDDSWSDEFIEEENQDDEDREEEENDE